MTGRDAAISSHRESKEAVSACWACSSGSKVVVGYSNGDIFLWAVPVVADQKNPVAFNKRESHATSNLPLLKLNLGYKLEKASIVSLRRVVGDGKASRLYVNGFSEVGSFHSFQVSSSYYWFHNCTLLQFNFPFFVFSSDAYVRN